MPFYLDYKRSAESALLKVVIIYSERKMAYDNNRGDFQRPQMNQGNWKCSKCGTDIKELPFVPDENRLDQLLCRECHRERRGTFKSNRRF